MFKASALTVSLLAAGLGVSALTGGAAASEGRRTAPHFDGPVVVGGLCSGTAAYYGSVRQDGDTVAATFHIRRAGVHVRWGLSTESSTDFGDGSGVAGAGDGFARSDADGHLTVHAATPLGVSHEFEIFLSRPKIGESCFVRVKV